MGNIVKNVKILLVDDNEASLSFTELMLKDEYEVIPVLSGKDALELLNNGLVPDLILLDIAMPEMDGWKVFFLMKAIRFLQDTPIAFFTSLNQPDNIKHAQEIGAVDYILKPCNKTNLLGRVKDIIRR